MMRPPLRTRDHDLSPQQFGLLPLKKPEAGKEIRLVLATKAPLRAVTRSADDLPFDQFHAPPPLRPDPHPRRRRSPAPSGARTLPSSRAAGASLHAERA